MTRRRALSTGLVLAGLVVLALLVRAMQDPEVPQKVPDPVDAEPPRPVQRVYPLPAPPPPPPEPVEDPVTAPVAQEAVPRDAAVAFSNAANQVMGALRAECVNPWMEDGGPDEAEFALNALVVEGRVVEFELLTVLEALPEDVVSCVRDVAWSHPWPEVEMAGEVRFQRSMHAKRRTWADDGD